MTDRMDRLERLRRVLEQQKLAAYLVAVPQNVRYLSGFSGGADAMLLVTGTEQYIFTDSRYQTQAGQESADWRLVLVKKGLIAGAVGLLQRLQPATLGFEADYLTCSQYLLLQEQLEGTELQPAGGVIEAFRQVKDEQEIALLREAAAITCAAYRGVLGEIATGVTEMEIAGLIECNMRRLGGGSPAFETIVAAGERGALPHGLASERKLQRGDLVVLDLGATYQGYCGDLTRTVAVAVCGEKERQVYELVRQAQLQAVQAVRAGVTGGEVDAVARGYLTEAGYGDYFNHSLGHSVGLYIHEGPRLAPGSDTVLQAGMVVTVEPGVYLPGWGGVRIEDTVLVTERGCDILTPISKELAVI
jgi:Xaa-Pro aminopeptidase